MLPWRRSKFVLAGEEPKPKAKSGGGGPSYHGVLSSLLRSCPDLLPDCPLHWVGAIFHGRRQKVELNREEPVYGVRYLGSVVTIAAKGDGCTQDAVAKLWSRSNFGEQSVKMRLAVGPQGIRMATDKGGKKKPAHLYSLSRITHCSADAARPKILAWVYRHRVRNMAVVLRCHAALLPKARQAQAAARSLYQNATSAFSEFKRLKRQSDFRHCRQQLLGGGAVPEVPLRRLLNGQCHYRPPAEHDEAAPRLFAIAEEEEEEEWGGAAPRQSLRRLELAPPRAASEIYIHAHKPELTVRLRARPGEGTRALPLQLQPLQAHTGPAVAPDTSRRTQGSSSLLHERGNATTPLGKRHVCHRLVRLLRHGHALQGNPLRGGGGPGQLWSSVPPQPTHPPLQQVAAELLRCSSVAAESHARVNAAVRATNPPLCLLSAAGEEHEHERAAHQQHAG